MSELSERIVEALAGEPEESRLERSEDGTWHRFVGPKETPIEELEDGALVDPETGECFGYAPVLDQAFGGIPVWPDLGPKEQVDLADSMLDRRARVHARREGLIHERNLLIASIEERFETLIKREERKIGWIDLVFAPLFEHVARRLKGKTQSAVRPFARLQFKKSSEKLAVVNEKEALGMLTEVGRLDAIRLRMDFENRDPANVRKILAFLDAQPWPNIEIEIMVSRLKGDELRGALNGHGFEWHPSGETEAFDVKH